MSVKTAGPQVKARKVKLQIKVKHKATCDCDCPKCTGHNGLTYHCGKSFSGCTRNRGDREP